MTKHFWIYTHNFTHSGAPLVMASIARQLAAVGWRDRLRVVSWGGLHDRRHSTLQNELSAEGIHCRVLDHDQSPPKPHSGDQLLLNSLVLPEHVIQQALDWRSQHRLSRLDWYAHEGDPAICLPGSMWPDQLRFALQAGQLQLRVPSVHTLSTYQRWLNYSDDALAVLWPELDLPLELWGSSANNFQELRLQLTAAVGSGHKGHLWLLQLVAAALEECPQTTVGLRPIRLRFIGVEQGPYAALARHVCQQGEQLLGDSFAWVPAQERYLALQAMAESNIAVSCSLSETFSLVMAEAMALGQPLLRTRTGGWQEQLVDAEAGFDLGEVTASPQSDQVAVLQRLRDPERVPEARLQRMRLHSQRQAARFSDAKYGAWLCS